MFVISTISTWWTGLGGFSQIMFVIGCAMTVFLLIQIIMMLAGLGNDASFDLDTSLDDMDADVDLFNDEGISDVFGLKLISIRTITAFLAVGSWIAMLCDTWLDWYWALLIGAAAGVVAAVGVAFAMRGIMRLQSEGNINIENAIGKIGDVYLTIPAKREGTGKINVLVQEVLVEREAITDSQDAIKTGEKIRVVDVLNQGTVIVERSM